MYKHMRSRRESKKSELMLPLVQNVVSFAEMEIEGKLNLKVIAEKIEGSRYNHKRFPAVIMRKTMPKCTVLCFASGRMIVIGSKSESDAESAARKATKDISKVLGFKTEMKAFRITNIVANADIGFRVQIARLSREKNVVRNENFPGIVYKNLRTIKSVLVFGSGKVVFTGAKSKDDIDNAFKELREKLKDFAMADSEK